MKNGQSYSDLNKKMVATRYQEKPSYEFQNLTTFFETQSLLNGKSSEWASL
jgi:hypothetical protein